MIKNEKVLSVMTGYQTTSVLETLERAGLAIEGFKLILSDKNYAQSVVRYANNLLLGSAELDNQLLSLLDDSHFFGPSDWLRYYRTKIENFELPISIAKLENILNEECPFIPGYKVKDTHYLFCLPSYYNGTPLTINQWDSIYKHDTSITLCSLNDQDRVCDYSDSSKRFFNFSTKKTANFNWYLMFGGIIPNLINKNFFEQRDLLKKDQYEVPKAVEVLPMFFLFWEKNRQLLGKDYQAYGRTSDKYLENANIIIDTTDRNGEKIAIYNGSRINFARNYDETKDPSLSVYAFKKLSLKPNIKNKKNREK